MQTANSVDVDKVISACFDLVENMFSHDAAQLLLIGKSLFVYLSVTYQIHINIQIYIKIKYI